MIGYKENELAIKEYFGYVLEFLKGKEKFSENMEVNWRLGQHERQPRQMAVL
jgi:hypothetical protein